MGLRGPSALALCSTPSRRPELGSDGVRQRLGYLLAGMQQVGRDNDRAGVRTRFDLVEDRFELGARAAEQDHVSAVLGVGQCRCAADPITSAGDQHDTTGEQVRPRAITTFDS